MIHYLKALERFYDHLLAAASGRPVVQSILRVLRFLNQALIGFYRDAGWTMAAALSFSGSLAVIPTSALYFSVFSSFTHFQNAILKVRELILEHMLPESGLKSTIEQVFNQLTSNVYGLTFFSVISVMVTTIILYVTIEYTLNSIFMVRREPPFLRSMIVCTSLLFWGPILLGISGYMFLRAAQFPWVQSLDNPMLGYIMTLGISWLLFFLCYWVLPYTNAGLFPCLLGGIVAALLWEFAKWGFAIYLTNTLFYKEIYDALAFIPLSLVWMYFFWAIFLYGAEIAFCYRSPGTRSMVGKDSENDPILVAQATLASLIIIGEDFRRGVTPPSIHELALRIDVPSHIIQTGLLALEDQMIVLAVTRIRDTFIPCRPLNDIRLEDAFWAVFPRAVTVEEETPEMAQVGDLMEKMRQGIAQVFKGETLADILEGRGHNVLDNVLPLSQKNADPP